MILLHYRSIWQEIVKNVRSLYLFVFSQLYCSPSNKGIYIFQIEEDLVKRRGFSVMPKFKTKAMPHTEQQRIRNLRIAIERVHVGKYFMCNKMYLFI